MSPMTKTAIITGAGSGIGLAVAEAFLREGTSVVLNGRSEEKLVRAAAWLGEPDRRTTVAGDITRAETADRIVAAAVRRFGRVDVLRVTSGVT